MKQLLFCYKQYRKLRLRNTMLTDVFVPVQDIISPQKTTLIIPKTEKVELGDIVIIRDNDSNVIEYIGYIETLTNKINTEISCYPLINVFNNEYVLDQLFKSATNVDGTEVDIDVNVIEWLTTQIERAFIDTDDDLQALPLIIRNFTKRPVLYKKNINTANLFEVYTDLFISTGVYIVFSGLSYDGYEIDGIYCDIYNNTDENPYYFRYDNPQIQSVDIMDNTFTNYNKIIATEELEEGATREPARYYFYLLNDNSITTNPIDERRIKQVRSKEITFTLETEGEEGLTQEEKDERRAKALLISVYNELQAPEYNLEITITMFNNDNMKLYRRVDFVSDKTYNDNGVIKNVVYSSNVTKIEIVNDKQIIVTLGALRNNFTDFKKKVEEI